MLKVLFGGPGGVEERFLTVLVVIGFFIAMAILCVLAVIVGMPNLFGVPKEIERAGQLFVFILAGLVAVAYVIWGGQP